MAHSVAGSASQFSRNKLQCLLDTRIPDYSLFIIVIIIFEGGKCISNQLSTNTEKPTTYSY